eukprot:3533338-Amphidinium_carterae.1
MSTRCPCNSAVLNGFFGRGWGAVTCGQTLQVACVTAFDFAEQSGRFALKNAFSIEQQPGLFPARFDIA